MSVAVVGAGGHEDRLQSPHAQGAQPGQGERKLFFPFLASMLWGMMETCTAVCGSIQEGHPSWRSGKASWRKGHQTQELADEKELPKSTDKEKSGSSGRNRQGKPEFEVQ